MAALRGVGQLGHWPGSGPSDLVGVHLNRCFNHWRTVVLALGYALMNWGDLATIVILSFVGLLIVGLAGLHYWWRAHQKKKRRDRLVAKYQDRNIAIRIIDGQYWQGQTEEQLRDSLGSPADVDVDVMKTKTKHTWKYLQDGTNRFRLRIIVENGTVVGWKER